MSLSDEIKYYGRWAVLGLAIGTAYASCSHTNAEEPTVLEEATLQPAVYLKREEQKTYSL